ncbi:MAG TPA: GlsB/YeaQ/YmgE family stress response membrane protein [Chthonomonadaceae bacterium]|nr:GlsB/YeaQ/YmgE family stress response membrane protein [Chthonomonadaceae bacterium]
MSILAWIIVGVIAGFLAKVIMPGTRDEPSGFLGTMLLGIVGAVVGGWMWNLFLGQPGATGIDFWSIVVALVGACIVIALLRVFDNRRALHY